MGSNVNDGMAAANASLGSDSALYVLDVSTTTAAITLPNGHYRVYLKSGTATVTVVCKIGAAATIPTTGNTSDDSFAFPGTGAETFAIATDDGTKTFNAILTAAASADTLFITKIR
jgi:hypothetical protein